MQKDIFLAKEADNWFLRNKDKILNEEKNYFPLEVVLPYLAARKKILEVGCSVGNNLNYLQEVCSNELELTGIEPSQLAIKEGQKRFEDIRFIQDTAEGVSRLNDEKFDVIIFGFCLYLVDRESIQEIIQATYEKLSNKGILVIVDFDTKNPFQNEYSHQAGVYSFKADYGNIFAQHPFLHLIEKKSWSHYGNEFHSDPNERCATSVLIKEEKL
jgi:SAM-dependent methyltransferase